MASVAGGRHPGGGHFRIGPDHIEIGSFIGLAAVTRSALRISHLRKEDIDNLRAIRLGFQRLGIHCSSSRRAARATAPAISSSRPSSRAQHQA